MRQSNFALTVATTAWLVFSAGVSAPVRAQAAPLPISEVPLYLAQATPPLNMLVMGKDHKNYYEAYNDAADLNGDGAIDVGYKPDVIEYYGYFNSKVCYVWNPSSNRFDPTAVATGTNGKQCVVGSGHWSGDFLNYVTTGRFDALRKVLYGGLRAVDSTTETVLQGAFFPQDGHSWGKEYQNVARDGFDISRYAPLGLPETGRYHLFAVTTLSDNSAPLLRVLQNSPYRIWNWVSIEGPVAGNGCFDSNNNRLTCVIGSGASPFPGHPRSRVAFDALETQYAIAANEYGIGTTQDRIDCSNNACNLTGSVHENYLSIITGSIRIKAGQAGNYRFRIDGDDNIDLRILNSSGVQVALAGCYPNGRGFGGTCNEVGSADTVNVDAMQPGNYTFKYRHEEASGGDGYRLSWERRSAAGGGGGTNGTNFPFRVLRVINTETGTDDPADARAAGGYVANPGFRFYNLTPPTSGSGRADYQVRVLTCPSTGALRETNCKAYGTGGSTVYKPTGILHEYGETNRMYFGLMTGSQANNLRGGVLRENISSFANEINATTGQFRTDVEGIARTLSRFRMTGGGYQGTVGDSNWAWGNGSGNCPTPDPNSRELLNGECRMWGNPIGEMMFEALRYFAGSPLPTPDYVTGGASQGVVDDTALGLTTESWKNPYVATVSGGLGFRSCAKPVMTVISDINPSYDSDLPGSAWNAPTFVLPTEISGFSSATEGQRIWNSEFGAGSRSVFIGQVNSTTDGAPTLKSASSFGTIRGLSPEEPTKEGSYASAAVSYYGWTKSGRINALTTEKLRTYSVALASPLPTIQFPVNGRQITFVPFAKTAGGTFGGGTRKPTNTIVDFYVEEFVNLPGQDQDVTINGGRPYAVFRINYEDVEQGNDHDMDAIVRYQFTANADNTVSVQLTSEYAAGSAIQHMGYIATGTTTDGVYLDVRDRDTNEGDSPSYIFNTPPGRAAGYCNVGTVPADCRPLPLTANRTFTPGGSGTAVTTLRDPLWYAAKYGGFNDDNNNGRPDNVGEWDTNADGNPDNYFLVTNALTLRDELAKAFAQIENDSRPSGGTAASGARRDGDFLAFVPEYNADDWTGDVKAYPLRANGTLDDLAWSVNEELPAEGARKLYAMVPVSGSLVARPLTVAGLGGTLTATAALGLTATGITASYGATTTIDDVVSYLRGNTAKEVRNGGVFRDRSRLIGDVLGSQPEVLGRGSQGYTQLPAAQGGGVTGTGSYGAFVRDVKLARTPVLFVGSNDGMLHAFNAARIGGGGELFAIAPNATLAKMGRLAAPNYAHTYFVDAPPAQGDAFLGGQWKSIVVAAGGAGAKSVLVVDATNPVVSFGPTNVLREVSDAGMGNILGRGQIILAEDNRWYAAFGNGLNNSLNQSGLLLIDLATGAVRRIMTGTGTAADTNGMGAIAGVDGNDNGKVDIVYGGDYHGRMWKFDLSATNPTSWQVGSQPMFIATDSSGARQRFTGSLDVAPHFDGGYMVLGGTGRYLLTGDGIVAANPPIDTFYGVRDGGPVAGNSRAVLQQQQISSQLNSGLGNVRVTTENAVDFSTKRGWFVDFFFGTGAGERSIGEPRVILGRVLFTSFIPMGDECAPGGTNWLFSLSSLTGAPRLDLVDTNNDGIADTPVGGLQITPPGQSAPPATAPPVVVTPPTTTPEPVGGEDNLGDDLVPDPDNPLPPPTPPNNSVNGRECVANLGVLTADGITQFGSVSCGRQSWRQIE